MTFLRQLSAMLWKNWLFTKRRWKLTLLQLLSPIIFVSILLGIDKLPKTGIDNPFNPLPRNLNQPSISYGLVPSCRSFPGFEDCVTIRYAPASYASENTIAHMDSLMSYIREESGLEGDGEFERMESEHELVDFLKQQPNKTTNALIFNAIHPAFYDYAILFNASSEVLDLIAPARKPDYRNELQIIVDKGILRFHNDTFMKDPNSTFYDPAERTPSLDIKYSHRRFPQLGYKGGQGAIEENGPAFFYCGIMFQFIVLLYNICNEKDLRLRQGLKTVGLLDSVYWLSWMITGMVLCIIASLLLIAYGYALDMIYFTQTSFAVNFMLFSLFSLAICALAMLCSVFIGKAKGSLNAGIVFFVLGLLLVRIISGNAKDLLFDYYSVDSSVPEVLSLLFPMFNLGTAMCEIKVKVSNGRFEWDSLYDVRYVNHTFEDDANTVVEVPIPNASASLVRLVLNAVIFIILASYLDQVLPSPNGEPRPWNFFLKSSFWFSRKQQPQQDASITNSKENMASLVSLESQMSLSRFGSINEEDADVFEEKLYVQGQTANNSSNVVGGSLLQVRGVVKTFNVKKKKKRTTFNAVDEVWFAAESEQVFVLLGHNGAGKSTLINILIGLLRSTKGDAVIDGFSVNEQIDQIRKSLGLCSQFEILWDELTAREHLQLYAELKGMPRAEIRTCVENLLSDVQLLKVADKTVGTFSGGMKRRLSVSISFVGDPKLVILDEPTSGMDPYVRRDIWNLILRMRKGRSILMTTHSMEEADAIGDKIAVMSQGKIKTLGTSMKLKNQYSGYCMTVCILPELKEKFFEFLLAYVNASHDYRKDKSITIDSIRYIYTKFNLAPGSDSGIVALLEEIEKSDWKAKTKDINFSQASLEDVFTKVTENDKEHEEEVSK